MFQNVLFPEEPDWFWHPARKPHEPGFTLFRRDFNCEKAAVLHLAVSADNRYNLYFDGNLLGRGPCVGDLQHYSYDEYRHSVTPGKHTIAIEVVVWQDGWRAAAAPWKEIHAGGGVMVCGHLGAVRLDMPEQWVCRMDEGRRPLEWNEAWNNKIMTPVAPMDLVDFNRFQSDWSTTEVRKEDWQALKRIGSVCFRNHRGDASTPWLLVPRQIAQMREEATAIAEIVAQSPGCSLYLEHGSLCGTFTKGKNRVLLDLGRNQTSIVTLRGKGGMGTCRCAYAETLFADGEKCRENRPEAGIGEYGYADRLIFPAAKNWSYRSFWYRTGRFIELELDLTEPLTEFALGIAFISYDFQRWMQFQSRGNAMLQNIWNTAIHTARCCVHESYEDCPYYEQLQYAGDSRIQALISYAATGDGTLGRQAIRHFNWSRDASGLTRSRYPSTYFQTIPQFSLIWVMMIHDHYRYFGDRSVILENWTGIESVLNYFENLRDSHALIGCVQEWNFTDWAENWPNGRSDRGTDEPETIVNLFYCIACRMTAELARCAGMPEQAAEYEKRSNLTRQSVRKHCWDAGKRRFQDVPGRPWYSLHANVLAILADAVPVERQKAFADAVIRDPELTAPTLYFRFYVLEAMKKCGHAEAFIQMLEPWKTMIRSGFTTFPEVPSGKTRSECHAWSAGPAYEFVTALLGIFPQREGISSVDRKLAMPAEWQIAGGFSSEPDFPKIPGIRQPSMNQKTGIPRIIFERERELV